MDPYFSQPEVSNSDLTELKKYFMPMEQRGDIEAAYRFGTLVDAIITEPEKVDYFNLRIEGHPHQYFPEEFAIAKEMLKAFRKNSMCAELIKKASFQNVMKQQGFGITYDDVDFSLNVRCKWDLWMPHVGWGGDIKSTTATTKKQFMQAIEYFDYDRQRAWYMDIAGAKNDVLIGISKKNFEVFVVPIDRNSDFYKQGKAKYQELAFKHWLLFDGVNIEEEILTTN